MNLSDTIELGIPTVAQDMELNEVSTMDWAMLGKCLVTPNSAANKVKGNDGKDYVYSYEVIMRKPKNIVPRENQMIHIVKKDKTVDKTLRVIGFVTLRNWLKIWV